MKCVGTLVRWFALSPYEQEGCGYCVIFLRLCGFSPGPPASSHSAKTCDACLKLAAHGAVGCLPMQPCDLTVDLLWI